MDKTYIISIKNKLSEPGEATDLDGNLVEYDAYPEWQVRCNLQYGCPAVLVSLGKVFKLSIRIYLNYLTIRIS